MQHNIPLSVADHLSPIFKDIFNDSEIAKAYSSASTKTTCILNGSLAPHFKSTLVEAMSSRPFAIAIDGSNDNSLEKMNPLTVRFFNERSSRVTTQFLDMCLTTGKNIVLRLALHITIGINSGTAQSIFEKIDEVFTSNALPWTHCVGVGVDNTSVNLGIRNSIRTRVLEKNPAVYIMGCPCHIVHNTALKASQRFLQVHVY